MAECGSGMDPDPVFLEKAQWSSSVEHCNYIYIMLNNTLNIPVLILAAKQHFHFLNGLPLICLEVVWSAPPIPFILTIESCVSVLLLLFLQQSLAACYEGRMTSSSSSVSSMILIMMMMMMICSCWLQLTPSLHWGSLQLDVEWAGITCITAVKYSAHTLGWGGLADLCRGSPSILGSCP